MTQIELLNKIRREIERLKKLLEESTYYLDNSQQALGYSFALDDFDEFLDTLQEQEVKEQKPQDTVGSVSVEIRSNLPTDEVVRKTLIMLVNDGRISVTGAITSSDILNWLEGQKEPEVDLEKFTEKMDAWKARYNHPDNIPIKATMAFTARMFYMYPKVAREWYDSLPKVTMD